MARMKPGVFSWDDVLAQRYQSNKPPALPHRRTIETPQPQPQSRLLARLSPELRLMIWGFVLGGGKRLGHVICPCSPYEDVKASKHSRQRSDNICDVCHGTGIPQPAKEGEFARSRNKVMLLSLALTCRQIYHESITLLYTLPTFEFSNPWSLPYLHPTIPHEHWESIRTVELRWSFPGHWLPSKDSVRTVYVSAGRTQWQETCQALKQMSSLRSFMLVLESTWFSESAGKLVGFLEPLRGLAVGPICKRDLRRDDLGLRNFDVPREYGREHGHGFAEESTGGSSSDEESCASLGSSQSSISETAAGFSRTRTIMDVALRMGRWELRLQGQSYYAHELQKIGDDLRQRGIDCLISAV
ncbi:hypothetical protein N7452_004877 [Penicillium brevicompactum]|uniref:DUF7730 domain-containing protein n=1 Tax=Penicillium brevicompactum TaxID=5074 RepID=A0A9W9UF55_PENBR|nr:hypothetical protein N7452_004877 [Penicillium brevicompactum]